jgi:hypothetical protein
VDARGLQRNRSHAAIPDGDVPTVGVRLASPAERGWSAGALPGQFSLQVEYRLSVPLRISGFMGFAVGCSLTVIWLLLIAISLIMFRVDLVTRG